MSSCKPTRVVMDWEQVESRVVGSRLAPAKSLTLLMWKGHLPRDQITENIRTVKSAGKKPSWLFSLFACLTQSIHAFMLRYYYGVLFTSLADVAEGR